MTFIAHSSGGWEVWNQGASTVNACFQDGRHQIPAVSSQMEGQQESWKGWGRPLMVLILSWGPHPGGLEGMVRTHHPKACSLGILNVLSWRHLKSSKCRHRLSLNPFDLSKNQAYSERNTIVIDLLPGSFINQGELTFHRGGDQKLHHTKIDCDKPSYLHQCFQGLVLLPWKSLALLSVASILPPLLLLK